MVYIACRGHEREREAGGYAPVMRERKREALRAIAGGREETAELGNEPARRDQQHFGLPGGGRQRLGGLEDGRGREKKARIGGEAARAVEIVDEILPESFREPVAR